MSVLLAIVATAVLIFLVANLSSSPKVIEKNLKHECATGDDQFVRLLGSLLGPGLLPGNAVRALHNGDEIFPAMLEAIRSARRSITMETYIYWSGSVGAEFADALAERARSQVKVHVVIDWVGAAKMDEDLLDRMQVAGVRVVKYHPLRWYNLGRLNNRTHRKLLVVDGKIGFTGGVGIADLWLGHAQDPEHWRDSHFRIDGPAVAQMQAAFMDNWIESEREVLLGDEYFPAIEASGTQTAQVFKSSATEASESVRLMYLISIASATTSVRIGNSYFVPDNLSVDTLVAARRRGVAIEIVVPGRHIDTAIVRSASRSRWGPLLDAGVKIYEYQQTMYHTKVMIVDSVWSSVGSTNFDSRSFRLNDEANLNVLDREFAEALEKMFERDRNRSQLITLEAWRRRPVPEKLLEWLAGLLRLQL